MFMDFYGLFSLITERKGEKCVFWELNSFYCVQ